MCKMKREREKGKAQNEQDKVITLFNVPQKNPLFSILKQIDEIFKHVFFSLFT